MNFRYEYKEEIVQYFRLFVLLCCGGGDPLQEAGLWKALSSGCSSVLTILGVKVSLSLLCVGW